MQQDILHQLPPLLRVNDDVLHEISRAVLGEWTPTNAAKNCDMRSLKSLAATCRQLRSVLAPQTFRKLRISISETAAGSPKSLLELQALRQCSMTKDHTKQIVLESEIPIGRAVVSCGGRRNKLGRLIDRAKRVRAKFQTVEEDLYEDSLPSEKPMPPSPAFAEELALVLGGLAKLETLALALTPAHTEHFHRAFIASNISFPLVRTLALGPFVDWLIPLCPNVATIATQSCHQWTQVSITHDRQPVLDFVSAASQAEKLRRLELNIPCELWAVEIVLEAVPDITELLLSNDHSHWNLWNRADPLLTNGKLLSMLREFSQLRSLEIPGVAVTPAWPWCGNAFDGPEGQQLYERLVKETTEAHRKAALEIVGACYDLEFVRVARDSAWTVERDREGRVSGLMEDTRLAKNRAF